MKTAVLVVVTLAAAADDTVYDSSYDDAEARGDMASSYGQSRFLQGSVGSEGTGSGEVVVQTCAGYLCPDNSTLVSNAATVTDPSDDTCCQTTTALEDDDDKLGGGAIAGIAIGGFILLAGAYIMIEKRNKASTQRPVSANRLVPGRARWKPVDINV